MGDKKNNVVFIGLILLLLVLFLEITPIVFNLGGRVFVGELFLLSLLIALSFVLTAILYFGINWAYLGYVVFFSVHLLNTLFLYFNYGFRFRLVVLLCGIGLLGLIISVVNIEVKEKKIRKIKPTPVEGFTPPPKDARIMLAEEFEKGTMSSTTFTPGKYIASKTGKTYHAPKCDWAKKIKKSNQFWLKDKVDAKKKGYVQHSCVE